MIQSGGESLPPFLTLPPDLIMSIGFTIRYLSPYAQEWRTQSFTSLDEALRMVDFYRSCGSPAELIK